MSAVLRRAATASLSLGLVTGLAACDDYTPPDEPQGATVFVLGARSNMPAMRLDGSGVDAVLRTVDEQRQASIVIADGAPTVDWTNFLVIEGGNSTAREVRRQDNQGALEDAVRAARAQEPETDLLSALTLASREAGAFDEPREIVVVDSGLSTAGPLDFTRPGLLDAVPEEVVGTLEAAGALPDLSGIDVTVQGLGDTSSPQESLSTAQRDNLVAIWTAVIEAAQAESLILEERPLVEAPLADLPPVTPVVPTEPIVCVDETVELSGAEVSFLPDSAEFRDPAAAKEAIAPLAEQFLADDVTATVTGTTARQGDRQGQQQLALARAGAVVEVLVRDFGVAEDALTPVGLGSYYADYVPDGGPDGPLDPGAAEQNRKVVIAATAGRLSCAPDSR